MVEIYPTNSFPLIECLPPSRTLNYISYKIKLYTVILLGPLQTSVDTQRHLMTRVVDIFLFLVLKFKN